MSTKQIIVTGATGQLGLEIREASPSLPGFEFVFFSRNELDLSNASAAKEKLSSIQPFCIINCAAYTAVDKAETERDEAFAINAEGPGILAGICKETGARFIHISTDYVFAGNSRTPYLEEDETAPVTVYGASKAEGERNVMRENPEAVIIRTAWVYSVYGKNFVKTMLRLFAEKPKLNVVSDQVGTPTSAADLAAAILHIIAFKTWHPGIYHYTNEGVTNWFEFATEIATLAGSNCEVLPVTTAEYPTPAKRPPYSVLSKEKIRKTFDLEIPGWKESLASCVQKLIS